MSAPTFRIVAVDLFERGVVLRMPFRFGVVTLTACPQAFARARIAIDGREFEGASAELLAPKWFDKNLALSNDDNFDQLRQSARLARDAYVDGTVRTAFGHAAAHYAEHERACAAHGLNPLIAGFGASLVDRAVLDALCRAHGVSFYAAMRANLPGLDATLTPDLAGFDIAAHLAALAPRNSIAVRHTVGLVDAITADDVVERVDDGLPETLEEVIAFYGNRWFKLKVSGNPDADAARMTRIAAVLDRLPDYQVTFDGNEQYQDAASAAAFWRQLASSPATRRLAAATHYIEQPLPRAITLATDVRALAAERPLLIDEADGTLDAFPRALQYGYTGVSSKQCKGLYKSLLNHARCAARGTGYFMSAEDLTTQAGLAVQQDTALVNLIGLTHVERNGHHYVHGFAGQGAAPAERHAFSAAQPGLYTGAGDDIRLDVRNGALDLASLAAPGFATSAYPDFAALSPMRQPDTPAVAAR
ncbi:MAG: mandelate racemase [Proteobacteria bacterium]|nr:mandelate racemase [Pseudomonadota bacterium]